MGKFQQKAIPSRTFVAEFQSSLQHPDTSSGSWGNHKSKSRYKYKPKPSLHLSEDPTLQVLGDKRMLLLNLQLILKHSKSRYTPLLMIDELRNGLHIVYQSLQKQELIQPLL